MRLKSPYDRAVDFKSFPRIESMGQAKRNRDALNETILCDLERYERPVTAEEEGLRSVLERLPVVRVQQPPYDQLIWMRMKPRECHANARFMEQNDPVPGRTKQVLGWMVSPMMFILHSVVQQGDELICVTPHIGGRNHSGEFQFAPDPELEMVLEPVAEGADEQRFRIKRKGASVMDHKEVRRDAAAVRHFAERVREQLRRGVHPLEAIAKVG